MVKGSTSHYNFTLDRLDQPVYECNSYGRYNDEDAMFIKFE